MNWTVGHSRRVVHNTALFSRNMTTNMFLEIASVVCYGVQVAVTSFSSSLAGKVAVAILFEILRCSCLLRFSVQLFFGVATLRICIRPRRPLVSGARREQHETCAPVQDCPFSFVRAS